MKNRAAFYSFLHVSARPFAHFSSYFRLSAYTTFIQCTVHIDVLIFILLICYPLGCTLLYCTLLYTWCTMYTYATHMQHKLKYSLDKLILHLDCAVQLYILHNMATYYGRCTFADTT